VLWWHYTTCGGRSTHEEVTTTTPPHEPSKAKHTPCLSTLPALARPNLPANMRRKVLNITLLVPLVPMIRVWKMTTLLSSEYVDRRRVLVIVFQSIFVLVRSWPNPGQLKSSWESETVVAIVLMNGLRQAVCFMHIH